MKAPPSRSPAVPLNNRHRGRGSTVVELGGFYHAGLEVSSEKCVCWLARCGRVCYDEGAPPDGVARKLNNKNRK